MTAGTSCSIRKPKVRKARLTCSLLRGGSGGETEEKCNESLLRCATLGVQTFVSEASGLFQWGEMSMDAYDQTCLRGEPPKTPRKLQILLMFSTVSVDSTQGSADQILSKPTSSSGSESIYIDQTLNREACQLDVNPEKGMVRERLSEKCCCGDVSFTGFCS